MSHLVYLAVLLACLVVTLPLEFVIGARVYRQPLRLLATLVPVLVVFACWDLAEIAAGAWDFGHRYLTGVWLPGGMPLEELLFFVVVPVCSILTLEAVRRLRPGWFADR